MKILYHYVPKLWWIYMLSMALIHATFPHTYSTYLVTPLSNLPEAYNLPRRRRRSWISDRYNT